MSFVSTTRLSASVRLLFAFRVEHSIDIYFINEIELFCLIKCTPFSLVLNVAHIVVVCSRDVFCYIGRV